MRPAGSGGAGAAAGSDGPDVVELGCGDGRVSLNEKCDIAIAAGKPGACPTECPPLANCVMRMLNGSNCDAVCEELLQQCTNGDGCCPSRCSNATDDDCSASCGDGVVQEDANETCEPTSEDPDDACKTQEDCDAEDDDPCTIDKLVGDPENCNTSCTHELNTSLIADDGCCPENANANTDNDCRPKCGNHVTEGDEQCDGGPGCNDKCELTHTPEQQACLDDHAADENACEVCTCTQCTQAAAACRDSDDGNRNRLCGAVAACANEKNCAGDVCYCGTTSPTFDCAWAPNGPCRTQVEAAAGSTSPAEVARQSGMPGSAIGRALTLGECVVANCADECRK
jgi:hypothetical protein